MGFFLLQDDVPSHPRKPAGDLLRNSTWERLMNQRVARTARASIDEWKKGCFWHADKLQTISSVVMDLEIGQLAGSRQNANAANTLL